MKVSLQNQPENFCSSTETDGHFLRYAPDEAIGKICTSKHENHVILARCSRAEECGGDTELRDPRCLVPLTFISRDALRDQKGVRHRLYLIVIASYLF